MKNNDNRVEFIVRKFNYFDYNIFTANSKIIIKMKILFSLQRTARIYNDALVDQLISSAERGGFIEIQRSRSFLDDETLDKLYTSVRLIALRNVSVSYLCLTLNI